MKKLSVLAVLIAVVLVCLSVAIVVSSDRKSKVAQSPTVKALQTQLKLEQDVRLQHDATNAAALHNAGAEIVSLTNQKVSLCATLKANKLTSPVCQ